MTPQTCHGVKRLVGRTDCVSGSASVDISVSVASSPTFPSFDYPATGCTQSPPPRPSPVKGRQGGGGTYSGPAYPATVLMRAIISSTALSTGTFSLTTRFIALAQTFSLLSTVNL